MSLRWVVKGSLALLLVVVTWASAPPAGAVSNPDYTSAAPTSVVLTATPARTTASSAQISQAAQTSQASQTSSARTQLAITGSDAVGLSVIGSGLVATGALVLIARRRTTAAS